MYVDYRALTLCGAYTETNTYMALSENWKRLVAIKVYVQDVFLFNILLMSI
jgi:hypothetical protein